MKKYLGHLLLIAFLSWTVTGCDSQKPANEVEDAKGRVKKKIEDAREKQDAENPEQQEESE